jgi:hypothetical protein
MAVGQATVVTADEYVRAIVARKKASTGEGSPGYAAYIAMYPIIREWAAGYLAEMKFSGSYAKGTAIRGGTDVDFFLSLVETTPGTLKEIYSSLVTFLRGKGFSPRAQNVSVGITVGSTKIDLVPGRRQSNYTGDHSLYRRKADTWMQTNIDKHIFCVRGSLRVDDICAVKVWRQLRNVEFMSFFLELLVIEALKGQRYDTPAANLWMALQFIANNVETVRIVDPANTNNVISDDMTLEEKRKVAAAARETLNATQWGQVIW